MRRSVRFAVVLMLAVAAAGCGRKGRDLTLPADLLALLPGELAVEPLGSHGLKGWPVPVEVYALRGLVASAPPSPAPS